jgi:putative (di)nucleoside polyphosphate hydrolase
VCIGQKQRWFLLRMLGGEDRLRFDLTSQPEFDSWRWVDYWSPVREVIYFKRNVYARALDELGRIAFADGPPPRPEWWSEAVLRPAPRSRAARPVAAPVVEPVTEPVTQ